jgi:hypothetical protein
MSGEGSTAEKYRAEKYRAEKCRPVRGNCHFSARHFSAFWD